ncbi:SURF1 family protein [Jatrophihabitans fulvus]
MSRRSKAEAVRPAYLARLREPRYAALGVLMLVVALVCVACGVWQIFRYESKHDENQVLRANAKLPAVAPAQVLPLVGSRDPTRNGVEFRQLRVSGRYDGAAETLVRNRTDGDATGFLVVTPLQTADATLLIVRGFVAQPASGAQPAPPSAPSGTVTVLARAQPPESRDDQFGSLPGRQVSSINPRQQAERLGGAVYDGFAQLESGQAGTGGLTVLPRPDLSNPAGGALEPQHFAYVVQWFLFAALALAAPFAMIRAESRRRDDGEVDLVDEQPEPVAGPPSQEDVRAAKLADRYGRPVH